MIISNDTFAVHFVEAEVRGDGEEGEQPQHEAHGGGGQQGGGGRGRGRGDGAAHRSWTSLNAHCCVFPWVLLRGESFICVLSYVS